MIGEALTTLVDLLGRTILLAGASDKTFWLPEQASTLAERVDADWALVYWVSVVFFALITFLMFYFAIRYRGRPGDKPQKSASHNTSLEVFWSVIPTLIVVVMFWQGYKTFLDMVTPPENSYEILVTGQKWNWSFTYPNGYVDGKLHVPVGTPVQLVLSSDDVIHSLFIPEMRVKRDVVPGRYNKLWFEASRTGEFDIFCTEYCGTEHSTMLSTLFVHERGEFDAWLEEASDFLSRMSPAEAGELLYNMRGCKQCHSVDGTAGIAPTFQGLFGTTETLADGSTVLVDENYVRQSIYEPMAQITSGFEPVMPTYAGRLKEEEVGAIIEYLKTLVE